MNFDVFDDSIGVSGYFEIIKNIMSPHSTPFSFSIAAFTASEKLILKVLIFQELGRLVKKKQMK